jgi:D-glycero-D-manno-heptose 1,7-bisphosphate phosphatase
VSRRAIFLDRDGTLNEEINYLGRVEDFRWLPGAPQAVRILNDQGWAVVLITNQSGIGRGYYTEQDALAVHQHIQAELAQVGAHLDAILYCPHQPDEHCPCRKPQAYLFEQAARDLDLDLAHSYAIGDKLSDLEPGQALGCQTILVLTGHGQTHLRLAHERGFQPDYVATDLANAVEWITGDKSGSRPSSCPEVKQ